MHVAIMLDDHQPATLAINRRRRVRRFARVICVLAG
jgi:hypothetical protein